MVNWSLFKDIIAHVESGNYLQAIRFEPTLFRSWSRRQVAVKRIREIHRCSRKTSLMIATTSFGKYQILGYNIWEVLGFDLHLCLFLSSEHFQDMYFKKFIQLISGDTYYLDFVKDIIKELEFLNNIRLFKNVSNLNQKLKEVEPKITTLKKFIRKYNGAIFNTLNFQNYLLRMLYHYNKLKGGVK